MSSNTDERIRRIMTAFVPLFPSSSSLFSHFSHSPLTNSFAPPSLSTPVASSSTSSVRCNISPTGFQAPASPRSSELDCFSRRLRCYDLSSHQVVSELDDPRQHRYAYDYYLKRPVTTSNCLDPDFEGHYLHSWTNLELNDSRQHYYGYADDAKRLAMTSNHSDPESKGHYLHHWTKFEHTFTEIQSSKASPMSAQQFRSVAQQSRSVFSSQGKGFSREMDVSACSSLDWLMKLQHELLQIRQQFREEQMQLRKDIRVIMAEFRECIQDLMYSGNSMHEEFALQTSAIEKQSDSAQEILDYEVGEPIQMDLSGIEVTSGKPQTNITTYLQTGAFVDHGDFVRIKNVSLCFALLNRYVKNEFSSHSTSLNDIKFHGLPLPRFVGNFSSVLKLPIKCSLLQILGDEGTLLEDTDHRLTWPQQQHFTLTCVLACFGHLCRISGLRFTHTPFALLHYGSSPFLGKRRGGVCNRVNDMDME